MKAAWNRNVGVWLMSFRLGFKQAKGELVANIGRFVILATVVTAYRGVFRWVPTEDLARFDLTRTNLIWYLMMTEFFVFCSSMHYRDFQYEIQDGVLPLGLLRPCPLWILKTGDWIGQYIFRLIFLAIPSAALAGFLSGDYAPFPFFLLGTLLSIPFGIAIFLAMHFIIGGACLWTKQAEPVFWFWQKGLFLLGGLLWPLAFYPLTLHIFTWFTPFPAMLSAAGLWVTNASTGLHILSFLHQLFWVAVTFIACNAMNDAMLRRIQRTGIKMRKLLRDIDYIAALLMANWKTHLLGLKRTLILGFLMFAQNFLFFAMWIIFFGSVKQIKGWGLEEVGTLYGTVALSFGLSLFLFDGARRIADYLRDGAIDHFLTRPRHPLIAILFSRSNAQSLGDIISGPFYCLLFGHMPLNKLGFWFLLVCCSVVIFVSTIIIMFSLAFWLYRGAGQLSQQLFEMLLIFSMTPSHGQPLPVQIVMYSVLPVAFISLFPVTLTRNFDWPPMLMLLAAVPIYAALAVLVFNAGLRHYRQQAGGLL